MATLHTRCCIAGGGPAGMMLGLLLARAGVDVLVLEKHADFLRDFRGDTVHPSTLEVLHELGLLEDFLARPHDKAYDIHVDIGGERAHIADFRRLKTRCGFIAMMPQWEFLDFLRDEGERHASFRALLRTRAEGLIDEGGRVVGVRAAGSDGPLEIRADLVVGADGRHSTLRGAAGLPVRDLGAPIDVLWMRVTKLPTDVSGSGGRVGTGRFVALIDRGSYWQCAFVIHKGGIEAIRARGLPAFLADFAALVPRFAGRLAADLPDWEAIKLLSVSVDRLEQWWKPGLLCIGDAAHAMSPIGGVGINLAIQDAVAAGNILGPALADPACTPAALDALLPRVQQRRLFPTRVTQAVQVAAQNRLINPLLDSTQAPRMPAALKLLNRFPALRALPAYAVGIGARPEHVLPARKKS
ncbi:FAD-dependent oxidoreductase [Caenimonas sedimenti]|uniref:FAD-dependent oxidoreductase n=1 Tax=Caenimonas sedimenti TaxID=2596921 RepID=A0A562ZIL5_9BURK|nr:FAD-dependent oxidoreductase [Caenimonas sedimenti]TWO68422.1 FAD-dependent oxidoreductase [Caenimonas sedimenti]